LSALAWYTWLWLGWYFTVAAYRRFDDHRFGPALGRVALDVAVAAIGALIVYRGRRSRRPLESKIIRASLWTIVFGFPWVVILASSLSGP
jgi:hypothetical protein